MGMREDQSYGIIPVRRHEEEWEVFLVQLHAGHWGFPKGHGENEETPYETASREFTEETGMTISRLVSEEIFEETYFFKQNNTLIKKTVGYFLAEVTGKVNLQAKEIALGKWVALAKVEQQLTFAQLKHLFEEVLSRKLLKLF
jgi:bis(5'-nucleosidyl)-tetraphosphatase